MGLRYAPTSKRNRNEVWMHRINNQTVMLDQGWFQNEFMFHIVPVVKINSKSATIRDQHLESWLHDSRHDGLVWNGESNRVNYVAQEEKRSRPAEDWRVRKVEGGFGWRAQSRREFEIQGREYGSIKLEFALTNEIFSPIRVQKCSEPRFALVRVAGCLFNGGKKKGGGDCIWATLKSYGLAILDERSLEAAQLRNCSGIDGQGCRVTWAQRAGERGRKSPSRTTVLRCLRGGPEMIAGEMLGEAVRKRMALLTGIKAQT
ncbi:hypothetical protein K438DRAFT_1790385 [Mycena galopus ATCC 62051]|nr:hypothetical protein K438DRAFT_1790385 [Mycena galopus ATCC 62051]